MFSAGGCNSQNEKSMGKRKRLSQMKCLTQFPCTLNFVNSAIWVGGTFFLHDKQSKIWNLQEEREERDPTSFFIVPFQGQKSIQGGFLHSWWCCSIYILHLHHHHHWERWLITTRGCIAAVEGVTEEDLMFWYCWSFLGLHCLGLWCFTSSERGAYIPF